MLLAQNGFVVFDASALLNQECLSEICEDYQLLKQDSFISGGEQSLVRHIYDATKCQRIMALAKRVESLFNGIFGPLLDKPYIGDTTGTVTFVNAVAKGTLNQKWHRDTDFPALVLLMPFAVDTTVQNGCTQLLINTVNHHQADWRSLATEPGRLINLCLKVGQIALFDARLLHRGTKNTTDVDRPVLIFTITSSLEYFEQSTSDPIYSRD